MDYAGCLAGRSAAPTARARSGVRGVDGLQIPVGGHGQLPHLEGEQVVDAAVGGN